MALAALLEETSNSLNMAVAGENASLMASQNLPQPRSTSEPASS